MISTKIKEIRSANLNSIGHERSPHHRRLRCCHGRFQQRFVADTACASMPGQYLAVNGFYRRHRQMLD